MDNVKKQVNEINAVLASMDDEELYGKELYIYTFSQKPLRMNFYLLIRLLFWVLMKRK